MLLAACEIADHDGRQRVGALQPHHVTGIELDVENVDAFAIRNKIAPVRPLRRFQRSGDDLEVDGRVGIGEDEQFVATIGERVLHAALAGGDQARRRIQIGKIDQALFGGFVIAAGNHAKAAA